MFKTGSCKLFMTNRNKVRKINRAIKIRIYPNTNRLKMLRMSTVRLKLHRQIPEEWRLKSVTVSNEPSGKYFTSLLFCCENQAVEKAAYPMFYRRAEKNWRENRESCPSVRKEAEITGNKKRGLLCPMCNEKIRKQRKDFQHKLSTSLAERYDAVCVEDLSLKAMAEDAISEKVYMTMDMGSFLPCWSISWKNEGNIWLK